MNPIPEKYNGNNEIQIADSVKLFSIIQNDFGYSPEFQTVIDVGCGTGRVTNEFLKVAKCDQLIAFDKNQRMVNFARENHQRSEIKYEVADVTDDFTKLKSDLKLANKADVVFSVHCINWVGDKAKAFSNIYKLLKSGGRCYLLFIYWSDLFVVENEFAQKSKWSNYFINLDEFYFSYAPFHTSTLPDVDHTKKKWTQMLQTSCFSNCNITVKEHSYLFKDFEDFKNFNLTVCPIINLIPSSEKEEFTKNYFDYITNNYNLAFTNKAEPYEHRGSPEDTVDNKIKYFFQITGCSNAAIRSCMFKIHYYRSY